MYWTQLEYLCLSAMNFWYFWSKFYSSASVALQLMYKMKIIKKLFPVCPHHCEGFILQSGVFKTLLFYCHLLNYSYSA